jgi:hypothetical protein
MAAHIGGIVLDNFNNILIIIVLDNFNNNIDDITEPYYHI